MAIIYLPKNDYSLKKNSKMLEPLMEKNNINSEEYETHIQPFFETLNGFYQATGHQLKRFGIFPKMKYFIDGISLKDTLDYVLKNNNELRFPIQDIASKAIESSRSAKFLPNHSPLVRRGIAIQNYDKQTGLFLISRDTNKEKRYAKLDDITKEKIWIATSSLSDEAIDRIIG